jgi:hypothetical protein
MSGIIYNVPPIIPTPPINATSTIMPVKDVDTFIDSNIKNVVNQYIETINDLGNFIGLRINFFDNTTTIGNLTNCNIVVDANGGGEISLNGNLTSTPTVAPDKFLRISNNGDVYYIQLNVEI